MVKVSEVLPSTVTPLPPKALLIVGGATTKRRGIASRGPSRLRATHGARCVGEGSSVVVPFTFTLKVQIAGCGIVPPANVMLVVPAVAVIVPVPHDPTRPLGVDTVMPLSVSLKATWLRELEPFGLVMVKVRVVEPLSGTLVGLNRLRDASAEGQRSSSLSYWSRRRQFAYEEMTPVVLDLTPPLLAVTLTMIVQFVLTASATREGYCSLSPPQPSPCAAIIHQPVWRRD